MCLRSGVPCNPYLWTGADLTPIDWCSSPLRVLGGVDRRPRRRRRRNSIESDTVALWSPTDTSRLTAWSIPFRAAVASRSSETPAASRITAKAQTTAMRPNDAERSKRGAYADRAGFARENGVVRPKRGRPFEPLAGNAISELSRREAG